MDPRVALHLPEDDRGRRAMLENDWAKGVKLDVKWHPIPHESHAALDAASMVAFIERWIHGSSPRMTGRGGHVGE
ncbi:hypothetical protein [Prosthecochloris sp.]|uniref:hypothetical protein n=1 Tax=Prosthecochloris sp. TaxID=290513 RepID=UPI0025F60313|nr:hypothetical protein [Prosthecochloris sp.]